MDILYGYCGEGLDLGTDLLCNESWSCSPLGDMNDDGFVDILDAIEVVNLVLNGDYNELVDMNYDGTINILDIIDIIYIILN